MVFHTGQFALGWLGFYGCSMIAPKGQASDYIDFLIPTPKACSGAVASRVQPDHPDAPAHDAFTRLLTRWQRSRPACGPSPLPGCGATTGC